MLEIKRAAVSKQTARILQELLTEKGVHVGRPGDAFLCYGYAGGVPMRVPALNRYAGRFNKLEELTRLASHGVRVPTLWDAPNPGERAPIHFPMVGRLLEHADGSGMFYCRNQEAVEFALDAGARYFTEFLPSVREFRVWVLGGRALLSHIKVHSSPEKANPRLPWVRTYRYGWTMQCLTRGNTPAIVEVLAVNAVNALMLDFGGVDIIENQQDGRFYVLEVNSAPGVFSKKSRAIKLFASGVAAWEKSGYDPDMLNTGG